ncbi:transporter substrate-binding domain-containing protein [Psychromonas sp. Urea-02u-13]|uniref:transporter substrate-binding domain-containing protein n=1 Tax=Psychromonas sp. Urea-02u-13 TaxID=2058326 RepID=UPI000C33CA1B|nr:transporter substrate-binding domain-containing protein [Psychromonas sp. Urea-02u-13]PKG37471.1 hypothetical protein CXF74_18735 [Psychromonas sp. Urea-02u-13]
MNKIMRIFPFVFLFLNVSAFAESLPVVQKIIVWNQLLNHPNPIVAELLNKVFQVTEKEYGAYQLIPSEIMEQGRAIRQIKLEQSLHIGLFAPNKERNNSAISIPIPVTGSLLSYRICLIRKNEQHRFNQIKNIDNLIDSKLLIGQHKSWSDTNILKSNGLTLWTTYKYSLLFEQLVAKRFDCFARGANEILGEYYDNGYKGLDIEQSFVIHYPLPLYFYVNAAKPALAERVKKGMTILIENGQYQRLFNYYFANTIKRLKLTQRTVLTLENPLLTEQARKQMLHDAPFYKKLINNAYLSK